MSSTTSPTFDAGPWRRSARAAVEAAIAAAAHLGDDQADAIRALAGPGPALRALIAPAGHGKTTTLAVAVDAAHRAGRDVLALSTTNQAVDQLRQVGIPAVTVARFALDGDPLEPGMIVIVDEFSQLPTHEADTLLAAVAGCPDAAGVDGRRPPTRPSRSGPAGWPLGWPTRSDSGNLPVAELTENRRQTDPVERQALTAFRHGQVTTSQDLREQAGWEHHHRDPEHALAAMAAAVLGDIEAHGAEQVAALAVTHADCEALADRIRADLAEQGTITGPTLEGPGWDGPRAYQAGDRILLHAHANLPDGRRLTNGTVATILDVTTAGLTVTTDTTRQTAVVPPEFVISRAPTADPRSPTPGPGPSTASKAAPGPRSTSSPPRPSTATAATSANPAPSPPPTPGTPSATTPTATTADGSSYPVRPRQSRSPPPSPGPNPRPSPPPTTPTAPPRPYAPSRPSTAPTSTPAPPTSTTASPRPPQPSPVENETWPTPATGSPTGRNNTTPPPASGASPPLADGPTTPPPTTSTP